jgi:hypothetical protein
MSQDEQNSDAEGLYVEVASEGASPGIEAAISLKAYLGERWYTFDARPRACQRRLSSRHKLIPGQKLPQFDCDQRSSGYARRVLNADMSSDIFKLTTKFEGLNSG